MKTCRILPLLVLSVLAAGPHVPAAAPGAAVTVRNTLDLARPSEAIVLTGAAIRKAMPVEDLRTVHVVDDASGQELIAQAVDLDDDGAFDEVVFQADLAAGAIRTFTLAIGPRHIYTKDQFRAYGRFVRERRDDFAWENDLVAHRMYGMALETWAQEPLTSSSVDVWFKRTRRLVINEWYMVDDYHRDLGEGADMYSAGRSRGCGGNGIWDAGRLYTSANFTESKVIANGPIRVMFELMYPAFDAAGNRVTEIKRITLDAGHHLNRFESRYTGAPAVPARQAAGIKKAPGSQIAQDQARGVLRTWEPVKADGSHFGCGVIVDPAQLVEFVEADGNVLAVTGMAAGSRVTYYAGSAWDRGGVIKTVDDWDRRLAQAEQRIRTPVAVSIAAK